MRLLIISALVFSAFILPSFSQGYIYFDGSNNNNTNVYAGAEGLVFLNQVLDTQTDINCELWWSQNSNGPFSPVVTLLLSSSNEVYATSPGSIQSAAGDITTRGSGNLIDPSFNAYALPGTVPGQLVYFVVLAWMGNYSSYLNAVTTPAHNSQVAATLFFPEVLTSASGAPNDIENMPALNLSGPVYSLGSPVYAPANLTLAAGAPGGFTATVTDEKNIIGCQWYKNDTLVEYDTNLVQVGITNEYGGSWSSIYYINNAQTNNSGTYYAVFFAARLGLYVGPNDPDPPAILTVVQSNTVQGVSTHITNPVRLGSGLVQFTFANLPGATCTVLASTNVALPFNTWSNLGYAVESPVGSGQFQFTDSSSASSGQMFYRVVSP
jgi:hypothetical protein